MALARYHIGRFLHHADDVRMPDNKICRSGKGGADTTTYAHWDSIINERVKLIRDSLLSYHWEQTEKQVKDSTYIKDDVKTRVDESGKVLGKDSTHIEIRYRDSKELSKVRDSLIHYKEIAERASIYKAQRDSLNRELSIAQTKKEYIEKDLEGWDLFYWKFGMISFGSFP